MIKLKKSTGIVTVIMLLLISGCGSNDSLTEQKDPTGERIKFNEVWSVTMDQSIYDSITIPHTPRIEPLIVNDQWQGHLTYTKSFAIDNFDEGKTIIHFEGVMHEAKVFINDQKVKEHVGGYLPFSIDLTSYLIKGINKLKVEVYNTNNQSIPPGKLLEGLDFNFYGGIYRDVWLQRKNDIHITDPFIENTKEAGWLIHFSEVNETMAKGTVRIQLRNDSKETKTISADIKLSHGEVVHEFSRTDTLKAAEVKSITVPIEIANPKRWSVKNPLLYELSIAIETDNHIYDRVEDKVGIRRIDLSEEGFYLNGQKVYISGTNRHQEYPYVGYAISNNANYRDAVKIKKAGFDFVRLSHYPQDESFLDACDELGILVMNAIPGWQYFGDSVFIQNSYQDIRDMVRRDRNHPSVVFWEVSLNESAMTDEYMNRANEILKEELPFTDTYSAGWMDHESYDLFIPARQHGKAPDYWNNYRTQERLLFIAEYGDWEYYAHNAGFNQAAYEGLKEDERTSRQLRAHGAQRLLQQALNFQEAANSNRKGSNTIGDANWLMFDYNRGYADDLEASGIGDIFRIPKFAYYFYQSQRSPADTLALTGNTDPMVKIASYWTESSNPLVTIYSNCEEVALSLNGELIDRKMTKADSYSDQLDFPPFQFDLAAFQKGELKAIGYINGKAVAQNTVRTAGRASQLELAIDLSGMPLSEKEQDLVFVYASVLDEQGTLVNTSDAEITFSTNAGVFIGQNPIMAEAGIASILLKVNGTAKKIQIKATSDGLKSSQKEF